MPYNSKQSRHLPAFLLLFLTDGPAHGGALWNRVQDLGSVSNADSGAIYRVLRDLEERGSIESSWDTSEPGPARRIYQLTSVGLDELQMWYDDITIRKRNLEFFLSQFESKFGEQRTQS